MDKDYLDLSLPIYWAPMSFASCDRSYIVRTCDWQMPHAMQLVRSDKDGDLANLGYTHNPFLKSAGESRLICGLPFPQIYSCEVLP